MLRFRRTAALLAFPTLALSLAACGDLTGLDRLTITVAVSPERIFPGDTATIVVRFTNLTVSTVELPNHCVYSYQIANAQGEVVVGNEPIFCTLELRPPVVLGPFESVERRYTWNGYRRRLNGAAWVTEPVSAGLYRVYGRLDGRLSAPDTIEVQTP